MYDIRFDVMADFRQTSLLADRTEFLRERVYKQGMGDIRGALARRLKHPRYDFVRESPRFAAIIDKLSENKK